MINEKMKRLAGMPVNEDKWYKGEDDDENLIMYAYRDVRDQLESYVKSVIKKKEKELVQLAYTGRLLDIERAVLVIRTGTQFLKTKKISNFGIYGVDEPERMVIAGIGQQIEKYNYENKRKAAKILRAGNNPSSEMKKHILSYLQREWVNGGRIDTRGLK
jgi:hypothetical protein